MRFTLQQIASLSCFTLLVEAIPGFWNTPGKPIDPTIKAILEGIDEIKNHNILQKAITLSILDLLIDIADDNNAVSPTERTKVLTIARTLSRKHRRAASIFPSPSDEGVESLSTRIFAL